VQRLITLGLAFYSLFLIKTNIPHLPARIPTHFNAAGEADGWGSPDTLWHLLVVQVLICGLFLAMPLLGRRFPGGVNVGRRRLSDFAPAQRERIMRLLTDMMGYMSVLLSLLFSILLREIIHASSSSHPHFAPKWELGFFLAGTAATFIYYLGRINTVADEMRPGDRSVM
jgi:uncharacterized membrane protein